MRNYRLRQAREEMGYTQEEMAKMLGYKQRSTYANWENGRVMPRLSVAIKIADILGEDIGYLFYGKKVQDSHITSIEKDKLQKKDE